MGAIHSLTLTRRLTGWLNFEMMAWDWVQLSESDKHTGLEHRFKTGSIDRAEYERLNERIAFFQRGRKQRSDAD